MAFLELRNLSKAYGAAKVIHEINLSIEAGEFVVFVGPSGCGKSTLLRMIAGLEDVTDGVIEIDGSDVSDFEPAERGVAMVFQSYALYPHMSVAENIGFGLEMSRTRKAESERRIAEAAEILQISHLLDRKPKQLSGGQRQRVAIGRAIVRDPKIFLFDEPLSNLDASLRVDMRVKISQLHQRLRATMIYVTHDQVEAMTLADKIVVLEAGGISQVGSPMDLYDRPDNLFVAAFIGNVRMNLLRGRATLGSNGRTRIELETGREIFVSSLPDGLEEITVGVRPEHVTLSPGEGEVVLHEGDATVIERLGDATLVYSEFQPDRSLTAKLNGSPPMTEGQRLKFSTTLDRLHLFGADGRRLAQSDV